MSEKEVAGLNCSGEHVIGLTACDIYAAYLKNRNALRVVDMAEVWQPVGDEKFMIVNTTFMLRRMLADLGYESTDIEKAMGPNISQTKI